MVSPKKCIACGADFTPLHFNAKLCSLSCKVVYKKEWHKKYRGATGYKERKNELAKARYDLTGKTPKSRTEDRAWYSRNKEKMAEYQRRSRAANPERYREYSRRYYEKHRDRVRLLERLARRNEKERVRTAFRILANLGVTL